MKKNRKTVIGMIAATALSALLAVPALAEPGNTIPKEGNLLKNGDAETGDITGWQHDYPGFTTLYEAQETSKFFSNTDVSPHNGKYALISDIFIECYHDLSWQLSNYVEFPEDSENTSVVWLYQDVDVSNMSAGTELILRGYVTVDGYLKAAFLDQDKKVITETVAKDREIKDDGCWKFQRASMKVPTNAKSCRVYLVSSFHRFKGTASPYGPYGEYTWGGFDDVSLCVKKAPTYTATKATLDGEILKNGGGESGNLDGWHYEYEDFVVFRPVAKTDFYCYDNVSARTGSYCMASDFYWQNTDSFHDDSGGSFYLSDDLSVKDNEATVSMYQEVDLSGIPEGTRLVLDGFVGGEGSISMTFYDSANAALLTKACENKEKKESSGWQEQTVTVATPAKAASLKVFLTGKFYRSTGGYGGPLGEYTRGAFDDISLKAVKDSTTVQPQDGAKKTNPMSVKVTKKTFSRSKHLKKAKSFNLGVKNAQGKVSYTLSAKAKKAKIKVTKKGKVTVPKKCKKGNYSITVKAAGTDGYDSKTVTVKIVVKK